jgi:glycosyltransferase involved in cell wall biosynthesis
MSWTTIQLGSREHYAIPIALYGDCCLDRLITDTWLSKAASKVIQPFLASLAARRSCQLPDSKVSSNTLGRLMIDAKLRVGGRTYWDSIVERNKWFGEWAAKQSAKVGSSTVFSYCYTARLPFAESRNRGARCILGQIDPGPREEEVVLEATRNYRHLAPPADRAPQKYWDLWRQELAMADKIVVNSPWSAKLLVEEGVPTAKLVEIPLVYERADSTCGEWRVTSDESGEGKLKSGKAEPKTGPSQRLKALFLGSVILRKGVGQLFDAIKMLKSEPVDFTFAGPIGVRIPDEISQLQNVRFLGAVDKAMAEKLYRESDVFLFSTLSDGFGLTQLEALGHGLPVIASTHCGQVVDDRISGLVLPEVTPQAIAEAVLALVRDRDLLAELKSNAQVPDKCHPRHLASALLALGKS